MHAGENVIGARAWRVLFAGISLPMATVALFYFINHRYDGIPLWDIRGVSGIHTMLWVTNFVSFLLLYPSTFNLLEVAAVDKPKLHLWEAGVMRISRHPQVPHLERHLFV
jgi:zeta-carotene isomerase